MPNQTIQLRPAAVTPGNGAREPSLSAAPAAPPVPAAPARKTLQKPVAKPVAKPRTKAKARAAPKTQADLDRLARRLEADWQTALRKHEAAVNRQFHDLRAALHGRKASALKGKAMAEVRQALAPKLKPTKGRAKDLRRVEDALGNALSRIP